MPAAVNHLRHGGRAVTPTHVARQSGTVVPCALARPKGPWDAFSFILRLLLKYCLKKIKFIKKACSWSSPPPPNYPPSQSHMKDHKFITASSCINNIIIILSTSLLLLTFDHLEK
jgi:hypothetical protein